jgi:hypothetical protein
LETGNPDLHLANLSTALAYVVKGAPQEVLDGLGIDRRHEASGCIIGKRCGISQNIGPKALAGKGRGIGASLPITPYPQTPANQTGQGDGGNGLAPPIMDIALERPLAAGHSKGAAKAKSNKTNWRSWVGQPDAVLVAQIAAGGHESARLAAMPRDEALALVVRTQRLLKVTPTSVAEAA